MFLSAVSAKRPPAPAYLHPWVVAADKASYGFRANPRPPAVYGRRDGNAISIDECEPNRLCSGDVISFTFNVVYQITDKDWYPQYQPVEVYVLKKSAGDNLLEYEESAGNRPPPSSMSASNVEGEY